MGLTSLLFSNPILFLGLAVLLLYSVIAHEVAHGWVAYLFGDDTARRHGRLTFHPAPHIDPMGVLMLFLVGFGWARPVPVNYARLEHTRLGLCCVALAGCAANILIAVVSIFLLQVVDLDAHPLLAVALPILARINIILGAFNLIPLPPLDGSKVLLSFLTPEARLGFVRLEPYGFIILIFLLFTGLLNPVIMLMEHLIYGFIAVLFGFF